MLKKPETLSTQSRSLPNESPFFPFSEELEEKGTPSKSAAFVIGVCGGTASGKTSVCDHIVEKLGNSRVVILSQDSYYRGLSDEENEKAEEYNFDHPGAFDFDLIKEHLALLKKKKPIEVPHYDFVTHTRKKETTHVYGADVILFEGILVFFDPAVRELMDMKVFVDTDSDTRLIRRIRRDLENRGRTLDQVLVQYEKFVKPSHDTYIAPTVRHADVIIPRGKTNIVAIDLLVQHIKLELVEQKKTQRKK